MAKLSSRTVIGRFQERVQATPNHPAYWEKKNGRWEKTTWKELGDKAAAFGAALHEAGHGRGEKLAVMADTRPEWTICDLGALGAGAAVVGVYQTLTPEQAEYVIDHSDATTLIVQHQKYLDIILQIQSKLPKVKRIIAWEPVDRHQDDRILHLGEMMERGEKLLQADPRYFENLSREVRPDDTALIVYTSGTTGPPKGALLNHASTTFMMQQMGSLFDADENDVSFAFLPMAHVAEHVVGSFGRIELGYGGYYAQSVETVIDDLADARPTVFGSVPRIFEKVYAKVQSGLEEAPPAKQKLARWAIDTGIEAARRKREGKSLGLWLGLKRAVADKLVLSKIRGLFGGRVRYFISGAAPIAFEILEFFDGLGLTTYEVYGMTESTGLITSNHPGANKLGTVGRPIPGVEVKIAEDGEILSRGDHVFAGYFKSEEATKETVDAEGWLHTGDIGEFDADGFLRITDRKKNLIITAGGKNIAPANIEGLLKQDPLISQVLVHGDRRKFLSALITLEPEAAGKFAETHGLDPKNPRAIAKSDALRQHLQKHVDAVNEKLARYESIKRWEVLPEDFTVDNELLTPTMKVRRKQVEQRYGDVLNGFYEE